MATAATAPISYLIACCAIDKGWAGCLLLSGASLTSRQVAHFDWPTDKGLSLSRSLHSSLAASTGRQSLWPGWQSIATHVAIDGQPPQ